MRDAEIMHRLAQGVALLHGYPGSSIGSADTVQPFFYLPIPPASPGPGLSSSGMAGHQLPKCSFSLNGSSTHRLPHILPPMLGVSWPVNPPSLWVADLLGFLS